MDRTVNVVTLYVDIDGSTKMSFALPAKKLEQIIQVYSQEMSMIIANSDGYVLKFVGDAVIAIFPAEIDAKQASKNALDCAKTMIEVLTTWINPVFKAHSLPDVTIKVAVEYGKVLVVPYGKSPESSYIDIVGPTISIAAKMLPHAKPTQIIASQAIFNIFSSSLQQKNFVDLQIDKSEWSYVDEKSGLPYKLYLMRG